MFQGLGLLVTVLLSRNRPPPTTVAAGVPHANFAAELISLPSGLLAMVCEVIVTLKVRLRVGCMRASGGGRTVCRVPEVRLIVPYWILYRFPMWSESSCVVVRD